MRRGLAIFLFISALIVTFLVHSVFTLLTLLIEDGSTDAIHSFEIPAPNSPLIDNLPQLIPKIIHQTYVNESVPEHWRDAQQSCIELHSDYEYNMWTDAKSRELIATEYPWFLTTFDNYTHPIQRADAIRYFVLAHFGGIYIDLDYGCNRRLDPLLAFPSWVRKTVPTGISNDAMGAVPGHSFFLTVIEALKSYNRDWALPYITVMYSTGPLFLSVVWKKYMTSGADVGDHPAGGRVRILMQGDANQFAWRFFNRHRGSSWHGKDARLIFWMGRNWMLLTAVGFLVAGIVGMGVWWIYGRVLLLGQRRRGAKTRWRQIPAALWRTAGQKDYELLDRHDV